MTPFQRLTGEALRAQALMFNSPWPEPRAACAWDRHVKDLSPEDIEASLEAAAWRRSVGND